MLILTRRLDEAVTIGDDIEVTVLNVRDGRVTLGIRAPNKLVLREELVERTAHEANDD